MADDNPTTSTSENQPLAHLVILPNHLAPMMQQLARIPLLTQHQLQRRKSLLVI